MAEDNAVPAANPSPESATNPEPKVAGATVDTSSFKVKPVTRMAYDQQDWHTYDFRAIPANNQAGATFAWDFGDGATSVQQEVTHSFTKAGVYTVTLATIDNQGNIASQAQVFDVSFFHLQNPFVQATIGLLIVIIAGLTVFIVRLRRGNV